MLELVNKLTEIFNNLDDDIAYMYLTNDGYYYRQKNKTIYVGFINFDLKFNTFIDHHDILKNKEILSRIQKYYLDKEMFISLMRHENGFKVEVFNKYGNLQYRQVIKLFTTYNRLVKWHYKRKFPELVLDN